MSSATFKTQNIKRSVQEYLDGAGIGSPLYYDEALEPLPTDDCWVDVRWGSITPVDMASPQRRQTWLLFLDIWSRLKDDPLGGVLDALADTVRSKVRDSTRPKLIPLYDYTNPASPTASGFFIRLRLAGDDSMPTTDLVRGRSLTVECQYFERS